MDLRRFSRALEEEQSALTAVERFSQWHDSGLQGPRYQDLLPAAPPGAGQQYAFGVDLDRCSGCKSCVTACHSLNGLDETETWRTVGVLHGGTTEAPFQQHVTSACHHCVEPACMLGCPAMAYDKDPVTGIVVHLDDQCIGCQYCTLTCPYDVPKYNDELGIVRKCDMCSDRLAVGEAPACVQACPTQAISIDVVETVAVVASAAAADFVPGAAPPALTLPTTVYRSARPLPAGVRPADDHAFARQHAHPELMVMLVLTQLSVGAFCVDAALSPWLSPALRSGLGVGHASLALGLGVLALAASTLHLGRPLQAWRAVLGLRTSWLSREILSFGAFSGVAAGYAGSYWIAPLAGWWDVPSPPPALLESAQGVLRPLVAVTGLLGVFCSVMVYQRTRRRLWQGWRVARTFFASALLLGVSAVLLTSMLAQLWLDPAQALAQVHRVGIGLALVLLAATALKLPGDLSLLRHLGSRTHDVFHRAARLLSEDLRPVLVWRVALGLLGGVVLPLVFVGFALGASESSGILIAVAGLAFGATLVGELMERFLFFAGVDAPRMPGGIG